MRLNWLSELETTTTSLLTVAEYVLIKSPGAIRPKYLTPEMVPLTILASLFFCADWSLRSAKAATSASVCLALNKIVSEVPVRRNGSLPVMATEAISLGPSIRLSSVSGRQSWSLYFSRERALSARPSPRRSSGVPRSVALSITSTIDWKDGKKRACWSWGRDSASGSSSGFAFPINFFHGISSMVIPSIDAIRIVRFCSSLESRNSRSSCRFSLIALPPEKRSRVFSNPNFRVGRLLGLVLALPCLCFSSVPSSLSLSEAWFAWCLNQAVPGTWRFCSLL